MVGVCCKVLFVTIFYLINKLIYLLSLKYSMLIMNVLRKYTSLEQRYRILNVINLVFCKLSEAYAFYKVYCKTLL
jgi:hypothetical protein